jgi:hypothetical protein
MSRAPTSVDLVCHPLGPDTQVRTIRASLAPQEGGGLLLNYRLEGLFAGLRIPDTDTRLPPERLWAHTCFELFVAEAGGSAYREFNFSPNGQWMRFDFSAYRQHGDAPIGPAPSVQVSRGAESLDLTVRLAADALPNGELRLGLSAVVEHADGSHRYWALRHPPGQPDFHHRDGFTLALKAPAP